MVDLYGNAERYDRLRRDVKKWPMDKENREHILRYLQNCVDHLSPGRRCADLWQLRKLFVGTGANAGRPFVTKALSEYSIEDFEELRARLNREIRSRETYQKLANHIRNLYEQTFRHDRGRDRILQTLFLTGCRRFFKWPNDQLIATSIHPSKYYTHDELQRLLRVAGRPKERALLGGNRGQRPIFKLE